MSILFIKSAINSVGQSNEVETLQSPDSDFIKDVRAAEKKIYPNLLVS